MRIRRSRSSIMLNTPDRSAAGLSESVTRLQRVRIVVSRCEWDRGRGPRSNSLHRDIAPPCAGRDAGCGAEGSREVALLGKAGIQRDLGQTNAAVPKQSLGDLDPRVQMPEMRRAAGG